MLRCLCRPSATFAFPFAISMFVSCVIRPQCTCHGNGCVSSCLSQVVTARLNSRLRFESRRACRRTLLLAMDLQVDSLEQEVGDEYFDAVLTFEEDSALCVVSSFGNGAAWRTLLCISFRSWNVPHGNVSAKTVVVVLPASRATLLWLLPFLRGRGGFGFFLEGRQGQKEQGSCPLRSRSTT